MPSNLLVSGEILLNLLVGLLLLKELVEVVELVSGPSEIGAVVRVDVDWAVSSGDESEKSCLEGISSLV